MAGAAGYAIIAGTLLLAGLLLCGWVVFRFFGLYMMREISGLELFVMLALYLGLTLGAIGASSTSPSPISAIGPLFLLCLVGAAFLAVPGIVGRRRLRKLETQDIAAYLAALEKQPDVPYPHRRLGEIYQAHGDYDKAVEHYQAYLAIHAESGDVASKLKKALVAKRRKDLGLVRCPQCGTDNAPGATRCTNCGFYLRGMAEIAETFTRKEVSRILLWVVLIAIPLGTVLSFLEWVHPVFATIFLFFGACAAFFYWYARLTRA